MIRFRRYDPGDSEAVVALDGWAMHEAGTDPTDIPGHDDIGRIGSAYLDAGGEFLVGVPDASGERWTAEDWGPYGRERFETGDGLVVAMGGYLPNEDGYEDERTVPDAAELHRMRVAPPCQGRGYGAALLEELEQRIRATDSFARVLATTARRQRRALKLYSGAGYNRVGTSGYGEYELVHFEKSLPAVD